MNALDLRRLRPVILDMSEEEKIARRLKID
jgi:hypothetical protein